MQEANEYIQNGALNAIFILGRTTGLIGHYLDQQRLKQGLYVERLFFLIRCNSF